VPYLRGFGVRSGAAAWLPQERLAKEEAVSYYTIEPLDENEDVLGVFYGGRGQWGSQFVVTNRRLLLGPLDTSVAEAVLTGMANAASFAPAQVVAAVLEKYAPSNPKTIWLRHVVDVQPTNGASWSKAPGMTIHTAIEEQIDLQIVHKNTAPNWSKDNEGARDRFVSVLREAIASARAADGRG
jgi:hypothetical protein